MKPIVVASKRVIIETSREKKRSEESSRERQGKHEKGAKIKQDASDNKMRGSPGREMCG